MSLGLLTGVSMKVKYFKLVKTVINYLQYFSFRLTTFVSYSILTISFDYYAINSVGLIFSMYHHEVLRYMEQLLKSAIINNQNKIKFYSRGEKEILKSKREDR